MSVGISHLTEDGNLHNSERINRRTTHAQCSVLEELGTPGQSVEPRHAALFDRGRADGNEPTDSFSIQVKIQFGIGLVDLRDEHITTTRRDPLPLSHQSDARPSCRGLDKP
jgi:hypothetical protein